MGTLRASKSQVVAIHTIVCCLFLRNLIRQRCCCDSVLQSASSMTNSQQSHDNSSGTNYEVNDNGGEIIENTVAVTSLGRAEIWRAKNQSLDEEETKMVGYLRRRISLSYVIKSVSTWVTYWIDWFIFPTNCTSLSLWVFKATPTCASLWRLNLGPKLNWLVVSLWD